MSSIKNYKIQRFISESQVTTQGALTVEVYFQNKETGEVDTYPRHIKRAELARYYHEYRVIGSRNGMTIVEF